MANHSTTVEGLTYLLVSEPRNSDYVMRYTGSEMIECFTAEELQKLLTEGVLRRYVGKTDKVSCTFVNMVFAGQALRDQR